MCQVEIIAQIAVSAAVYAIDKPYDYLVPASMQEKLTPGLRVMVPFGRGNRQCEGVILSCTQAQDAATSLKSITSILDATPLLTQELLHMAAFIRERYFCTFYTAIKAILPAGVWHTPIEAYSAATDCQDWELQTKRKPEAQAVFRAILDLQGHAELKSLQRQFPDTEALQASLRYLCSKKLLTSTTSFRRKVNDKTEQLLTLSTSAEEAQRYAQKVRRSAPLQSAVLELLATIGSGSSKEVCYFTGASNATLRRLEQLGYLTLSQQEIFRRPQVTDAPPRAMELNAEQQAVFHGLRQQLEAEKPGTALLYGITGSGKTAVYLSLISHCLDMGKGAMLLVPEIALTPQLLQLFVSRFGSRVAIVHSALQIGERYDEWKRIRSGKAQLVIGTRSAVFAPVASLGLLILDEEQEHTYKSENSPRYHAREIALYRGNKANALVLLGSATPSMESMYRATTGTYSLYRLCSRYNGKELPSVEIADMKQELRAGNGTSISAPLRQQLEANIANGKQSILFLNRRGTSSMMLCVDCGQAPQCPRCSVSLTYHAANGRFMCHYCGHSQPYSSICPACGGHLKQIGTGTQKVQVELEQLFPGSRVLRMDADTISAANPHEKILQDFEQQHIPMLVGTQMVTKGLNFEDVTLVGVLDADMSLCLDNFRASETTFSMLTQVIGRAGRGRAAGRAIVQTMTPQNSIITMAAQQDYDQFYATEIQLRQLRSYPPFADIFSITFSGLVEAQVMEGAVRFREALHHTLSRATGLSPVTVLGPAPASITKVNNMYRYRLTLSGQNTRQFLQLLAAILKDFSKNKDNRHITVFVDTNPYDS